MGKLPSIGVVMATPGRASLYRTIRSIISQGLLPGDDVLIVGDGYSEAAAKLVEAFGPPFRYIATRATRDWGHSQINFGLKQVKGDFLLLQDDDDIFAPRAFDEARRLIAQHPGVAIIGRTKTPHFGLLWSEPSMKTLLDGHCLALPNDKKKLGFFTSAYDGDQCFLSTSVLPYMPELTWADRVWTITRPTWRLYPARKVGTGIYAENFHREIADRLPSVEGREANGEDDWTWLFYRESGSGAEPVAALRMYREDHRMWATMSYVPGEGEQAVIEEVVEYASWAAQGQDVWFCTYSSDEEIITELHKKGYTDHMTGKYRADFVMEWPPRWFPSKVIDEIVDNNGVHVLDWRDRWTA